MTLSISVVICAHASEREALLRSALNSIRRQSLAPLELIAVVDHNLGLHASIAASYRDVKVVENAYNAGLSGARNTGIKFARGEIIAFLDDDAEAAPDWLAKLAKGYRDPRAMAIGGKIIPIWPSERPGWLAEEFDWVIGCSYAGLPKSMSPVRNLIGCNMSFHRAVFERIGGFREGLGRSGRNSAGCEETELCIRAAKAFPQSTILYDPEIVVHHHIAAERLTWNYFSRRCWSEGRSKALVSRELGSERALASEVSYVTRVLPRAAWRGFRETMLATDSWGLPRTAAIMSGLFLAGSSYLFAKLLRAQRATSESFAPIRILDIERSAPLPEPTQMSPEGKRYGGVFCLVRDNGRPLGVAELDLHGQELSKANLVESISSVEIMNPAEVSERQVDGANQPYITVVVATHDRSASLSVCLDSLLRQDYSAFDIIVVDNAPSSTETHDLIADRYLATGRVRYVRDDQPGLGQAHNSGLAIVAAPIVAFTDDDVIVDRRWLSAMASAFAAGKSVACVTGLILPAELETRAQVWTERHGGFGKGFARKTFDLNGHRPSGRLFPYTAGQFGSGANMAFRTDTLRSLGGFDSALGAGTIARGGDDLAAFFSVVDAGYQLIYQPEAIVWHHHRRSEEGMRRQAFGYGVGLGAYLTKLVVDRPSRLFRFIVALPAGLIHMFGASSAKNKRLPSDYPKSLIWRERLGILVGVSAYMRSRSAVRRSRSQGIRSFAADGVLPR